MRKAARTTLAVLLSWPLLWAAAGEPAVQRPAGIPPEQEALIAQLGHNEHAKREEAEKKLEALGEKARAALQTAGLNEDLEVSTRARGLLARLHEKAVLGSLSAADKELAKLPFNDPTLSKDGESASCKVFGQGTQVIAEICDVRLVLRETPFNGDFTTNVVVNSSRSGSSSASSSFNKRKISNTYAKGTTSVNLLGIPITIAKGEMDLDGHKLPVGQGRKVVFLSSSGKFEKLVELDEGVVPAPRSAENKSGASASSSGSVPVGPGGK